jgi:hypothetical protein
MYQTAEYLVQLLYARLLVTFPTVVQAVPIQESIVENDRNNTSLSSL